MRRFIDAMVGCYFFRFWCFASDLSHGQGHECAGPSTWMKRETGQKSKFYFPAAAKATAAQPCADHHPSSFAAGVIVIVGLVWEINVVASITMITSIFRIIIAGGEEG
jgi:hypothetical protein